MDEVSELPYEVQAKLLRVASENEIQKIGGSVSKINTRIVSASNQDLSELVDAGKFRQDLLYRLNTIHIDIPPLRSRIDDIPELAEHLVGQFCSANNILPKALSQAAIDWMCEQEWKGNVRELKNTIERGVIFAKNDHLTVVDFTTEHCESSADEGSRSFRAVVHSFEKSYLERVLQFHDYNISKCANCLQMDKSNLFKKISSLGIIIPTK